MPEKTKMSLEEMKVSMTDVASHANVFPSRIAIIGQRNQGKTTQVRHLLNLLTHNHVFVIGPDSVRTSQYKDLNCEVWNESETSAYYQLEQLVKDCGKVEAAIQDTSRTVSFDTRVLVIIEELDGARVRQSTKWWNDFFINCEALNISLIVTAQYARALTPVMRSNVDYVFMTPGKFQWDIYNEFTESVIERYTKKQSPVRCKREEDEEEKTETKEEEPLLPLPPAMPLARVGGDGDSKEEVVDPEADRWTQLMANPTNVAILGYRNSGMTTLALKLIKYAPVHYRRVLVWPSKSSDVPLYNQYTHMVITGPTYPEIFKIIEDMLNLHKQRPELRALLVIEQHWMCISDGLKQLIEHIVVNGRHYGISVILTMQNPRDFPLTIRENIDHTLLTPPSAPAYTWVTHEGLGYDTCQLFRPRGVPSSQSTEIKDGQVYDVSYWTGVFENRRRALNIVIAGKRMTGKTTLAEKLVKQAFEAGYKRVVWIPTDKHRGAYPANINERYVWNESEEELKTALRKLIISQHHSLAVKTVMVIDTPMELVDKKSQSTFRELLMNGRSLGITVIMCLQDPRSLNPFMRDNIDYTLMHVDGTPSYTWTAYNSLTEEVIDAYWGRNNKLSSPPVSPSAAAAAAELEPSSPESSV